jgi:hypothetical protein
MVAIYTDRFTNLSRHCHQAAYDSTKTFVNIFSLTTDFIFGFHLNLNESANDFSGRLFVDFKTNFGLFWQRHKILT